MGCILLRKLLFSLKLAQYAISRYSKLHIMTKLIILRPHTDFRFPTSGLYFLPNFGIHLPKKPIFRKKYFIAIFIFSEAKQ